MKHFTCYLVLPEERRGFYSEEIDVEAEGITAAKKKAESLIQEGYDKRLKVKRVVWRPMPEVGVWA